MTLAIPQSLNLHHPSHKRMRSDYFSQRLVPSLEYPVLPSLLEDHERDQRFSKYYFRQLMQETNSKYVIVPYKRKLY